MNFQIIKANIHYLKIGKMLPKLFLTSKMKNFAKQSLRSLSFMFNSPETVNKYQKRYVPRTFSTYDCDGKTKVSILNTELDLGLMIVGFSQLGFRLNNEMVIVGPMALFPRSVLSWNINSYEDINEDSLSLFYTIEPKLDVLVIGIGDEPVTPKLSKRIIEFMRQHRINVEVLRTEQACATFNFLNAENRMVAAALIPPLHVSYNENDILQSKLRKKELYSTNLSD